jgi:hypothetical protein
MPSMMPPKNHWLITGMITATLLLRPVTRLEAFAETT